MNEGLVKKLKDNPLVRQFSLKSYNELIAAEHNIERKKGKLSTHKKDDPKDHIKNSFYYHIVIIEFSLN